MSVEKSNFFKPEETQSALGNNDFSPLLEIRTEQNLFRYFKTVHEGNKKRNDKTQDILNEQIESNNELDIKTNIANAQEGNTFLENIDANSEVIKIKDTVTKIKEEDKSANELNKTSIDGIKNEFLIEIGSDYERNMKTNNKNVYEEKKIYKCGECDVSFTTKNHLEEHITVHDQKEFFKCINCDRTFP